jgi:hypothetical protein
VALDLVMVDREQARAAGLDPTFSMHWDAARQVAGLLVNARGLEPGSSTLARGRGPAVTPEACRGFAAALSRVDAQDAFLVMDEGPSSVRDEPPSDTYRRRVDAALQAAEKFAAFAAAAADHGGFRVY